ncbi:hypothetical protein D3C78_716860 [compost metagenome]
MTERPGANPDQPILPLSNNEGSQYIRHVKQRISRLSDKKLRILRPSLRHRNRHMIMNDLCMLNDIRLANILLQILLQHTLDHGRVRAAAAQEGGGIEGARSRPKREALCINGNARQQCGRFPDIERNTIMNILQKLGNELTGGGSVRLHIDKNRIGNKLLAAAMMIDDYNPVRLR